MKTLSELVIIRNLIDSVLADQPTDQVQASLYSARLHIVQAIREQAATAEVREVA